MELIHVNVKKDLLEMQLIVLVCNCIFFIMIVLILLSKEIQNIDFVDCLFFITDVNECNNVTSCHVDATCNNTIGSYTCSCQDGYYGNGNNCTGMYLISDIMFVSKHHITVHMTREINKMLLERDHLLTQ